MSNCLAKITQSVGFFAIALYCTFPTPARVETVLLPPVDRTQPPESPAFVGRGRTISAAANLARQACRCLNEILIRKVVDKSLLSKEPSIIHLLDSTGQVGVLVHVNIQKLQGETPIYSVVGNDVSILGAGTSPSAVNLAYRQLDHLEVTTARGAIVDLDKSYFLWFSRADRALTAEMRSARGVISESARAFADDKILQSINKANDVAALGAAAAHLEKAMSDQRLRENLANLRQKQVDDEAKIKSIEEDLAKALDKARRAQATAATLTMISSAMTLASQIGTAVASLGQDAPPGLERASSPAELMNMVNDIALSADSSASRLRIEYKSHLNSRTDTRTEILSILRQSRYPISEVPQIIP